MRDEIKNKINQENKKKHYKIAIKRMSIISSINIK